MSPQPAVLLLSYGGPSTQEDIRPFLEKISSFAHLPKKTDDLHSHYEAISKAPSAKALSEERADALRQVFKKRGIGRPVYIAQRCWSPLIDETLRAMAQDGVTEATGILLSPHRTGKSVELYIKTLEQAQDKLLKEGLTAPKVRYAEPWYDHPLFIEAVAQRIQEGLSHNALKSPVWIYTAHAVPQALADRSLYVPELHQTIERIAAKLGQTHYRVAYQSPGASVRRKWSEPLLDTILEEEAKRKTKQVFVIPVGFIDSLIEVLYDLDVAAKKKTESLGMQFFRAPTVGCHPKFIELLAELSQ